MENQEPFRGCVIQFQFLGKMIKEMKNFYVAINLLNTVCKIPPFR